jgi:hypothetical protein
MRNTMFLRFLFTLCAITSMAAADHFVFFSPQMITSHLNGYNEAEKTAIEKDLTVVRSICFGHASPINGRAPVYVATAGGPGSRKTTILERFIAKHPELAHGVYLDPDPRALRFMVHSYYDQSLNYRMIAAGKNYGSVLEAAYDKWRGASNYITLTLMEEAFNQGMDIIHGTTSTGNHLEPFYTALKQAGYRIELLLCSCDDSVQEDALDFRNKEMRFYQSTPKDAIDKTKRFSEKMVLYFQYADKIYFFWSDALLQPERLAAILNGDSFEVLDFEAYVEFVGKYEIDRQKHLAEGLQLPSFNELLMKRTGKSQ